MALRLEAKTNVWRWWLVGLKETRTLSSLYERWYDPPRVCLYENIGKNIDRTIYSQSNIFHTSEIQIFSFRLQYFHATSFILVDLVGDKLNDFKVYYHVVTLLYLKTEWLIKGFKTAKLILLFETELMLLFDPIFWLKFVR